MWEDLLYKEVRSTLTITNSNIKISFLEYLNILNFFYLLRLIVDKRKPLKSVI